MTRVPAHTSEIGSKSLEQRTTWTYTYGSSGSGSSRGTVYTAFSYKSPTLNGNFHPKFKTFRMSTTYSRCVARLFSDGGIDVRHQSNGITYRYIGQDSRHTNGLSLSGAPRFSMTNGTVHVSSNTINRARAEALNKLTDQKINLAVALAEARKTVDYIASLVTRLLNLYRLLRRRDFSKLSKSLIADYKFRKRARRLVTSGEVSSYSRRFQREVRAAAKSKATASSWWLEYWYAFMPLIYDINGAIEQFQTGFKEKDLLFNVKRTVTVPISNTGFINANGQNQMRVSGSAEESCKVTLWGSVNTNLHYANVLGLINPAVVIWERVPFSFVIDWLVPVGNWLDSLTASLGVTFVDGHEVLRITASVTGETTRFFGVIPMSNSSMPRATAKVFAMQRRVYSSWPWAFPYWKSPLSTRNSVTALALLRQQRK